ncbi:hypothetical protein K1719_001522 [Acacia pycnantha]|nr:hypothetical protein K1719_001522 [Acacia pycnantha]
MRRNAIGMGKRTLEGGEDEQPERKRPALASILPLSNYAYSSLAEFDTVTPFTFAVEAHGSDYEEFVKAKKVDNETQFVEVNKAELAKILFPDLKHSDLFLGIVKSEPKRYTAYELTLIVRHSDSIDGTFSVDKTPKIAGPKDKTA